MLKRLFLAAALMVGACPAWAATNFLEAPGTNGFIATPFNLMSTELNTLASGACAISSVGGTSGVFSQTSSASAPWGMIYFTSGGSVSPAVGQSLQGWFNRSTDGGTTFETSVLTCSATQPPFARAPDFTIPLNNGGAPTYTTGILVMSPDPVGPLPWASYKVTIWNGGTGALALPASGNTIKLAPEAIQY